MTAIEEGENPCAILHRAIAKQEAVRLFTVSVLDRKAGLAWRAYSSDPTAYPVTGTKPLGRDAWSEMVIERGQTFIANTAAEFVPFFSDHALIEALGCRSAGNFPVKDDGLVVATVNLLDVEGYFDAGRVARVTNLIDVQRPALLRWLRSQI